MSPALSNPMIISNPVVLIIAISLLLCHPASSQPPPVDCLNQRCGNLTVSYPFKLTSSLACPSFSSFFELNCTSGKLFFNNAAFKDQQALTQLQMIEIGNDSLIVDITSFKTVLNTTNQTCGASSSSSIILPSSPGPYFISDDNEFGSFGCTLGVLLIAKSENKSSQRNSSQDDAGVSDIDVGGCVVSCPGDNNNPECGGHTCCVSPLPTGSSSRIASYTVELSPGYSSNNTDIPCSKNYATLFHRLFSDFDTESYRLKLKWALPSNQTTINGFDNVCSNHSNVTTVDGVPGYLCSCASGYKGDGYSEGAGCLDIDECANPSLNDCILGSTTCHNSNGSYTCKCNSLFYVGDGLNNGSGCRFSPSVRNAFSISGAILGLALLMGAFTFLAICWRQRTKRKYFTQNGGLQLQEYLGAGGRETTKLFGAEELKAATNNYSDQMKLGTGGFGTVFKGILEDGTAVAIKKANMGGDGDNQQFLNELAILTQINHRHIVRLLGCCLETAVPLLVYEYLSNGNVAENLESAGAAVMGWAQRLKVATQTAEALAYLHAAASPPILHRDVKTANVLLDDNLDAKVADFGVSRLVPDGVEHVSTAVQGTIGYLDPEYFQTLQLTDKSDVYSLGVMIVELLTGLKPVDSRNREPRFANLALLFIDRMQEGRGEELIDPRLDEGPSALPSDASWCTRRSIMAVATLALRCLALRGAKRPSMSHVVDELRLITRTLQQANEDDDEDVPLLSSKQRYAGDEAGAVVAQNAQYYVQSGSHSMSIDSLLLNVPTMPR